MDIWSLCLLGFDLSVACDSIIIIVCYYCRDDPYCGAHLPKPWTCMCGTFFGAILQLVLFCRPAAIAAYSAPHGAGRRPLYILG